MRSEILAAWHTLHLATSVHFFETVASTQTEARRLIAEGQGQGALVIAAEQTQGRGRFGREWYSPRGGNLYLSYVLQPPVALESWPRIGMAASLALAEAIEAVCALGVQLKWPNDVLVNERKVAGILCEVADEFLIAGVGVNVNAALPSSLADATSLSQATQQTINRSQLLVAFVERFDRYYGDFLNGVRLEQAWAARLHTLGKFVRVRAGQQLIEGLASGVTAEGALIIQCSDGTQVTCTAGEVTLHV